MRDVIARLDDVTTRLERLTQENGTDRRRALIGLRRELSVALDGVCRASHPDQAGTLAPDTLVLAQSKASSVRPTIALHQANWSAVLIDTNPLAYRKSADEALASLQDFLVWLKANMK